MHAKLNLLSIRYERAHSLLLKILHRFRSTSIAADSALLFTNTMANAVLGVVFWTIAAQRYNVAAVGFTSAIVAATTLIATCANLGFGPIIIRYLPVSGSRSWHIRIISTFIPATVALGVTLLLATLPFGVVIAPSLHSSDPIMTLVLVGLAVLTAIMLVQDSIFIARKQSTLVLLRGVVSAGVRLGALVPCARFGAPGLAMAFTMGALAAVALGATAWGQRVSGNSVWPAPPRQMLKYGGTNYISGLMSQTPQLLYPIFIAEYVSHAAAGAFAFAWMAAALLMALPPSVANVLMTQLVHYPDRALEHIQSTTKILVAVIIILSCIVFAGISLFAQLMLPATASDIQFLTPLLLSSVVFYAVVRVQSMSIALLANLRTLLAFNGTIALTAIIMPLILLPPFGVLGVEIGWLLSQLVGLLIGRMILAKGS